MWKKLFLNYKIIPFFRRLPNRKMAIFVHIPKTAGTSLKRSLGFPVAGKSKGKYRKHHTIPEMRAILPEKVWDRAFKFSIIRNPWDRMVSYYLFTKRKAFEKRGEVDFPDFKSWLHETLENEDLYQTIFMPQAAWLYDEQGQLMVDYVGRFENLETAYAEICAALKIDVPAELRHLNASKRSGSYHDFYDADTKALVARVCAEDVERFDYKF